MPPPKKSTLPEADKPLYGSRVFQLRLPAEDREVLALLFRSAGALYNQAMYLSRQRYIHEKRAPAGMSLFYEAPLAYQGKHAKPGRNLPQTAAQKKKGEAPKQAPPVYAPHPWTLRLGDRLPGGTVESFHGSLHRKVLPACVGDQVLHSAHEAWKGYFELLKVYFDPARGLPERPQPPGYVKKGAGFKLAFPNSGGSKPRIIELDGPDGHPRPYVRFPLGETLSAWFSLEYLTLPVPEGIDVTRVREWTLRKKNGQVVLEVSSTRERPMTLPLDPDQLLGIDPGTAENLAACVSTCSESILIDSRKLKSMNQGYNRLVAKYKSGKPEDYWDRHLDRLTLKRNNQMRDGINKAAVQIIQHCLQHGIGTIVFGWNRGIKDGVNLGKRTNQTFVQIPLARFKTRVGQLCLEYGIQFYEQEESYTSKASFLDGDTLPVFGSKPTGWTASGKRGVSGMRGVYRTAQGWRLNSDLNGAANILRKHVSAMGTAGQVSALTGVCRRQLTAAKRIFLWVKPRKTSFSPAV